MLSSRCRAREVTPSMQSLTGIGTAEGALLDSAVVTDGHQTWNVDPRCLVGCAQGSGHCRRRRLDHSSADMGSRC
jgi:hypothetical protein